VSAVSPPERASQTIRSARIGRQPPRFAVTVIAFVLVLTVAWVFFLRSSSSVTAPATQAIQGDYTLRVTAAGAEAGLSDEDGTFSLVAGGNAGGSADLPEAAGAPSLRPSRSGYDADGRTETTATGAGPAATFSRRVGAWPPVWRVATRSPLDYQGLAAVVRTAVEERDDAIGIKPLRDGDRAVWRAAITLDGAAVDLVVDQRSGVVTWYRDSLSTFTATVDWDSPPPDGATYGVEAPAGAGMRTIRDGRHAYHASPEAAGRAAGYDPLVSELAPDGYELSAVATTPADLRPVSWIDDGVRRLPTDPEGTAVLQMYTRGLSRFTAEQVGPATLRVLTAGADWQEEAGAGKLSYQEVTLQYGAFAGATASTWYQESGPSLVVAGERRAVFVTGALTREELISFAEGLKPPAPGEAR